MFWSFSFPCINYISFRLPSSICLFIGLFTLDSILHVRGFLMIFVRLCLLMLKFRIKKLIESSDHMKGTCWLTALLLNEKKLGGGGKRVEAMREVQKSTTQMASHLAWGGGGKHRPVSWLETYGDFQFYPLFSSCETFHKSLYLSDPQSAHVENDLKGLL